MRVDGALSRRLRSKHASDMLCSTASSDTVGQVKTRFVEGLRIPADKADKLVLQEQLSDFPADEDQRITRSPSLSAEQCWSPSQGYIADFGAAPAHPPNWLDDLSFDAIPVLHNLRYARMPAPRKPACATCV